MATEAVIWDMDGVIADTGRFHFRSWQELARENGIPFSQDDFKHSFGRRNPEILTSLFGPGLSTEEVRRLSNRKEKLFRMLMEGNVKPFPGALELMRSLRDRGFKQAMATSTPVENVALVLGALGIAHFFQHVVTDKDVDKGKPDPEAFLKAAAGLSVSPECGVVIEDAVDGVRAAKSAGMKCIAVTNTHPRDKLVEADMVVDSLTEVSVETIEGILHQGGRQWTS